MQTTKTYLELLQERGKKGLPLERVYRQLFNRDLYLTAYGKIYRNAGAMTHGITSETPDGMSLEFLDALIEALRYERFQVLPVRRVSIPKKNGKKRPLGIPDWSQKLVQEVVRMILSAYYEPQFSDHSHGFRPNRGCHTALEDISHNWKGPTWFLEGDISACFDKLDHEILLSILREHIHDGRFIHLMQEFLKAGYMQDWTYHETLSGTPQGGIVSPILANIYLDKLDKYVETTLIPPYTRGKRRKPNPEYNRLLNKAAGLRKQGKAVYRPEMEGLSDHEIVLIYQLRFRGLANYYQMAQNVRALYQVKWVMETSLTKTLAHKHKMSVRQVYRKYGAVHQVDGKPYKGLAVVIPREEKKPLIAKWGGIPLKRNREAILDDHPPHVYIGRSELEKRLLAQICEICGNTEKLEVHHIRAMKDLHKYPGREKPIWVRRMIERKRKTMIVCRTCHEDITYGRPFRRQPISLEETKALQKEAMLRY